MKEIILLLIVLIVLIVSQQLSYCLSATKFIDSTTNSPRDQFRENIEIQKNNKCWKVGHCYTPGARCGSELLCKCHNHRYPIPVPKTSQCLDYLTLKDVCLIGEQCSQENSICFRGKPIDIMTDDFVKAYLIGRVTHKHLFGVCQCKPGFSQMNGKCYQIYVDNLNCSRSSDCNSNVTKHLF